MLKNSTLLMPSELKRAKEFIKFLSNFSEISFVKSTTKFRHVYHLLKAHIINQAKVSIETL